MKNLTNSDLDLDGDIDVIGTNGQLWWYENQLRHPVSVIELNNQQITVFPNPCSNYIHLKGMEEEAYSYQLSSVSGRTIQSGIITSSHIDVTQLPKGTYLLTLVNQKNGKQRTGKVVKM